MRIFKQNYANTIISVTKSNIEAIERLNGVTMNKDTNYLYIDEYGEFTDILDILVNPDVCTKFEDAIRSVVKELIWLWELEETYDTKTVVTECFNFERNCDSCELSDITTQCPSDKAMKKYLKLANK